MPRPGAVVVSLNGGVGNQLFQYAAAQALATERGARLHVVPALAVGRRSLGAEDLLDLPPDPLTESERFRFGLPSTYLRGMPRVARRAVRVVMQRRSGYREIRQTTMQMADERPEFTADDRGLHLRGLFQHPSYYESALGDVTAAMEHKLRAEIDLRAGDGVVAIHFRRGDYLVHGFDLPMTFQEAGLAAVAERHEISRVLVMSDDNDFAILAAEHFEHRGFPAKAAIGDAMRSEAKDFYALAAAQHLVMSNSTFVWWAALLGDRLRPDGRVVVCPTPWMPMRASASIPSAALDLSRSSWLLHPVVP